MKIRKWTKVSLDKPIKISLYFKDEKKMIELRKDRGMRIMAVSMATIPVIRGDDARQMLEALKTPTITKEFIEKCKKETKDIIVTRIR